MRVLVFDTETTGLPQTKLLNPDTLHLWPSIVQFSYIIYDTTFNTIIDTRDNIVKIDESILISQESTNIHNITNEMCSKTGIEIEDLLVEFFYNVRAVDQIIGHNISFDLNMVKVELLRIIYGSKLSKEQIKSFKYDLHFITNYPNICCTLKDSIQLCNIQALTKFGKPYLKYPKLIELHQKLFDNSPTNLHNSFNDILVTLRCYMKLKHNVDLLESCISFKQFANKIGL